MAVLIRDVMTIYPVYINIRSTIHRAGEIISIAEVSDLMVVDDEKTFVGVLSEGDMLRAVLPNFDEVIEAGGTLVEEHDRRFLARLKLTIREGVLLFETHEAETGARAGTQLVNVLAQIPTLVGDYYRDLAASLPERAANPVASAATAAEQFGTSARRRTAAEIRATRVMRELPGHGTLVTLNEEQSNPTLPVQTAPE